MASRRASGRLSSGTDSAGPPDSAPPSGPWNTLPRAGQASHPETPVDVLKRLVNDHPGEVLRNPVLPLLALGDPAAWSEITDNATRHCLERRLEASLARASRSTLRLFAVECAAHVLPLIARSHPGETRPEKAIEAARRRATGLASAREMRAAREATGALLREPTDHARSPVTDVINAAIFAASDDEGSAARDAALSAAFAVAKAAGSAASSTSVEERAWQLALLDELTLAERGE